MAIRRPFETHLQHRTASPPPEALSDPVIRQRSRLLAGIVADGKAESFVRDLSLKVDPSRFGTIHTAVLARLVAVRHLQIAFPDADSLRVAGLHHFDPATFCKAIATLPKLSSLDVFGAVDLFRGLTGSLPRPQHLAIPCSALDNESVRRFLRESSISTLRLRDDLHEPTRSERAGHLHASLPWRSLRSITVHVDFRAGPKSRCLEMLSLLVRTVSHVITKARRVRAGS